MTNLTSLSPAATHGLPPRDLESLARAAGGSNPVDAASGSTFAQALQQTTSGSPDMPAPVKPSLRDAADQLVATAFILPLLEQAREDPFKSDLFHGGRGEEVFGQQLDVIFADRITRSADFGLSDAIAQQFSQSAKSSTPQTEIDLRG